MAKKPPKVGEIRIGRAGNKYNKWDGKRWVPVSAARTAGAGTRKASVVSKAVSKKETASTKETRPKTSKATYVPMTTRTRRELPTGSMNKASLIRRISGVEKSLSALRSRQAVSSGLAANKAQNQKEINRLEAELKKLKGKK